MKLAKYRTVEYVDDGVYRYQCLSCKEMFDIRSGPQNYCMNCGIKFDVKLDSRIKGLPRWVYDMYGNDYPWDMEIYPKRKRIFPNWIIQERTKWINEMSFLSRKENDGWSDWKTYQIIRDYSAHNAFSLLKRIRETNIEEEDDDIMREYRVIKGDLHV